MCLFFSQSQNTTENCKPGYLRGERQPPVLFGNSRSELGCEWVTCTGIPVDAAESKEVSAQQKKEGRT